MIKNQINFTFKKSVLIFFTEMMKVITISIKRLWFKIIKMISMEKLEEKEEENVLFQHR